eukprot:TRINITY_DN3655_c0_g2_i4.p1 TRINITY_DN3655_c0_g2~~TRINITY_DN3655_c0_g2_i4.p1  ORF type:complete len:231 (+),score=37.50 TRINITY_DN3655_c0_g2_i4:534-1226(+)
MDDDSAYWLKAPSTLGSLQWKDLSLIRGKRQFLSNISGRAIPGSILAVLGPSGCGKSTLLKILAGRPSGKVGGSIMYNGDEVGTKYRKHVAYCPQTDFLFPNLTVRECIDYQIQLKRGKIRSTERQQMVTDLILSFELQRIADHMTDIFQLSGGECRRLSLAQQVIGNEHTNIFILDEPITGLDLATAVKVVGILRKIADIGYTVILTVHQPSSLIFKKIDYTFVSFFPP